MNKLLNLISGNKKKLFIAVILIVGAIFLVKHLILAPSFLYAGTLEATKVDLSARLPAAISTITVYEGDRVQADEVLITLACEDYKIAAKLAELNYQRYLPLEQKGWASADVLDKFKKELEDADTKVGWCTIRSPIDGKVLSRYHEPGEWMEPGTKILTLANVKDIWAFIYVPQPLVAKLSYGMKLKGYLPELNNQVFEGTIIKISDEAEFTPKNVQTQYERERLVYGVKVSFLAVNQKEILKPGMTIEVELPK